MERREFTKDVLLASLALAVPTFHMGQKKDEHNSAWLKIVMHETSPKFDYFSIDSLGKNKLTENVILHDEEWTKKKHSIKKAGKKFSYFNSASPQNSIAVWDVTLNKKSFTISGKYQPHYQQSFLFNVEQHANHATLLGMIEENDNRIKLPAILHLPDMGSRWDSNPRTKNSTIAVLDESTIKSSISTFYNIEFAID